MWRSVSQLIKPAINGSRAIDCLLTVPCMKAPGKLPVLRKFSRGLYYIYRHIVQIEMAPGGHF